VAGTALQGGETAFLIIVLLFKRGGEEKWAVQSGKLRPRWETQRPYSWAGSGAGRVRREIPGRGV